VIVATGVEGRRAADQRVAEARPWDNVSALALREVPKRLVIIGAGVIGMELGTFFAEVGKPGDVLEMLPQASLPPSPEAVRILLRALEPRA